MILLTGAGGVVGREVMRQLLIEGSPVTAVARSETRFPDAVRVVGGDLFSPQWLESALEGVEAIQISPARLLGSLADYALNPGPATGTVEALLGRSALTFADWARDNAAAFGG